MKLKVLIATCIAFGTFFVSGAQTTQTGDGEEISNDLNAQFEQLKSRSNNYQEYKVVKKTALNSFWNSVEDTLKANGSEIHSLKGEVRDLETEVADLKTQVANRDKALDEREFQIEHMDFMGMSLTKSTYITLTWTLIFVLLIAVVVLWVRFKSAHSVTRNTRDELRVLQDEFDQHRKNSREKETKLRRDLQTEINRVEEFRGKFGDTDTPDPR